MKRTQPFFASYLFNSYRPASLVAWPLAVAGLFGSELPPAQAQQTLLEYSQPTAPQAGRYATQQYAVPATNNGAPMAGAPMTGAAPVVGSGNPFVRSGPPRASLLAAPTSASNAAVPASRYPANPYVVAAQPTTAQPTATQAPTELPTRPRYDEQVRPATYEMPATTPMTPVAPATPIATVGGPALAVAPNDTRYSQSPLPQSPQSQAYPQSSPYSQSQQFGSTQASAAGGSATIQTAATLPVPPLAGQPPHQLSGLAILRQKPLDENAARMQHPLTPLVAWLEDDLRQMDTLRDYSCTFKKREFVDGKLQDQQSMFVKMRMQPYSVYFYFLDPAVQGQEALYVAGRNNGNLLAHPIGIKKALVGTLSLAPNDPQAMDGNRYPITDFGIRRLAERFLERSRYEMQFGECDVKVIENARVNDRVCTCVQIVHPVKRSEFRYHMARLYIDNELNLPIRCEGYDWADRAGGEPQLIEEYTYSNLKLNVGLTDADFDPANPQYGFK
ncbi:MAG: DUF1571 domain-containing protein [Planctomycetia bacterium]|nr:DUF1571 domain-containing protein [Planctomycetia bacterium]